MFLNVSIHEEAKIQFKCKLLNLLTSIQMSERVIV